MQTTGNNLNAGSTTSDNALATSTNGNWDTASANRFVAAGGATPFLSVTVGMYASIYLDAATNAVFVSKVTAVDVGGTYIEVSKTANKLGTAPTAGATGRSCKVGGAWAGTALMSSLFLSQTIDQATRINVKAGTYAETSARAPTAAGTTALLLWWRGYNTTPGDLDDYSGLAKPLWNCTGSGRYTFAGNFTNYSNIEIACAVANPSVTISAADVKLHRCKITNTTANSAACALSLGGTRFVCSCCYLQSTSTATYIVDGANAVANFVFFGTVITGGGIGIGNLAQGADLSVMLCKFLSPGGRGIQSPQTTGSFRCYATTIYGSGSHGIEFTGAYTGNGSIINSNFWGVTGYGINASGGTTTTIFRAGNDFRSCSSGDENGLGDSPGAPGVSGATWGSQDEVSDPWTSATDMTPRIYSKAHQMALPRTFEYEPYNTYADVGAVTSQNTPIPTVGGHVARRT